MYFWYDFMLSEEKNWLDNPGSTYTAHHTPTAGSCGGTVQIDTWLSVPAIPNSHVSTEKQPSFGTKQNESVV